MGQHVTLDALRDAHQATPFQPFTIHLADGRRFRVPHPEYLSYSPRGGRTIIVHGSKPDSFSILDLLLVTELEIETEPRRRRRKSS